MDFMDLPSNFAMVGNLSLQQLPLTNKQPLQTQASPKAQVQSLLKTQVVPFPKPPTQPRSKPKMQRQPKSQLHKFQPFSKPCAQPLSKPRELFDGVRSKLRESLVAALALCDQTKNVQKNESKSSESEGVNASIMQSSAKLPELQVEIEVPPPREVPSVSILLSADPRLSDSTIVAANCTNLMPENPTKASASIDTEFNQSLNVDPIIRNPNDEAKLEFAKMWSCDQDFNPSVIFPEEETSFILKDDLLQGSGLCWASDLDLDNFDVNEIHEAKKFKPMEEDSFEMQNELSPQILAAKIEEELFKLFGSVNKKYKEKGRSLLFNLKDRNNPELRERVMAGKIPPEKLCSMKAEELASEELSQWRIAKAEELAQMVVLTDSEVDLRRVVKKTHKGEFQVEFEHDDGASVEVTIGESSLTNMPSQTTATKGLQTEKVKIDANEKISSDGDKPIVPVHDGTDLVQGPMVDDELQDTEFLPPIISLDEFVESLHDELAFNNSTGNGTKAVTLKEGNLESSGHVADLAKSNLKEAADILHLKKNAETEMSKKSDNNLKLDECEVESKVISGVDDRKCERAISGVDNSKDEVWNGILQLSISSLVTVAGYFKSGERTSTKEWPSLLEIKGRVRLDPFKKFLRELPKSRSRAFMVVQLSWEKDTSESVQSKVVALYVADERVGLTEPAPGVEMYICPADRNMLETLSGVLPKEHAESIKAVDGGLIGIVVWRRAMLSTSPRPSTHRQSSRKRHSSSLKKPQQGKRIRVEQPPTKTQDTPSTANPVSTPDDDVPPGFGPETCWKSQEDDDLPEFEFGHTSDCRVSKPEDSGKGLLGPPPRRVEQVRDLIHRYGQNKASSGPVSLGPSGRGAGIEIQPWNDDDDDIPDWQPSHEARPQSHPLPAAPQQLMGAVHPYHQFSIHSPRMVSQHLQVGLQPPSRKPYHSQSAQVPDQATQQPWQRPSPSGTPAIRVAAIAGHHYYSMPSQARTEWRPYR